MVYSSWLRNYTNNLFTSLAFLYDRADSKGKLKRSLRSMTGPVLSSRKELQQLLGFANLYRCFVWNFSFVAVPLMVLTSSKVPIEWSPGAQFEFDNLKRRLHFILILPDPNNQFRSRHLILEFEGCYPSKARVIGYTPEPSFQSAFLQLSATAALVTGSSSP